MSINLSDRFRALADGAAAWRDPDHEPREAAVEATLAAPNRWTDEALTHVLSHRMQAVTETALREWLGEELPSGEPTVGVLHGPAGPLDGLRLALATWGLGLDYVGAVPDASPHLLPAFADEVRGGLPGTHIEFGGEDAVLEAADVLLARPESAEAAASLRDRCEAHGLGESRRLLQPPVYSVGLVDGHETDDERERLAEDMLLLEGTGRRRVAVLWAPRGLSPDPYLESMARFRGFFPVHEDTPGTLQMQQAFLEARDEPHAYAEGLEFLVSRGDPEPQKAGHVRWAEYDDQAEVTEWLAAHTDETYALIARPGLHDQIRVPGPLRTPGGVHTPPLDDPEGRTVVQFLRAAT